MMIERGIIAVIYTLLTLNMFLKTEKLFLSRYNNLKMFVCTRRCELSLVTMQRLTLIIPIQS